MRIFLQDRLIMRINPAKINYFVGTKRPNKIEINEKNQGYNYLRILPHKALVKIRNRADCFLIRSEAYRDAVDISTLPKYLKVKDFIENIKHYEKSIWFNELVTELHAFGFAKHKKILMHDEEGIHEFVNSYLIPLITTMESNGYDLKQNREIGAVLINSDGSLHKAGSANHRFFAARVLGLSSFPVFVSGVHEDWYLEKIGNKRNLKLLGSRLLEVEEEYA